MQKTTQSSSKIEPLLQDKPQVGSKKSSIGNLPKSFKSSQVTGSPNSLEKAIEAKREPGFQKQPLSAHDLTSEPLIDIYLLKNDTETKPFPNEKRLGKKPVDSSKLTGPSAKVPSLFHSNQSSHKDSNNDSQKVKQKAIADKMQRLQIKEELGKDKKRSGSPKLKVVFQNEKGRRVGDKDVAEFGFASDPFKVGANWAKYQSENLRNDQAESQVDFKNSSLKAGDKKRLMRKRQVVRDSSSESSESLENQRGANEQLEHYDIYKNREQQKTKADEKAEESSKASTGKKDTRQSDSGHAEEKSGNAEVVRSRKHNSSVPANKELLGNHEELFKKLNPANFNMSGLMKESDTSEAQKDPYDVPVKIRKVNFDNDKQSLKNRIRQFFKEAPPGSKFQTTIDFYKIKELVGKGRYGKVYLATHKLTDKNVAIKMSEKTNIKCMTAMQRIFEEANLLASLNHPNVIKLYEIFENEKYYFFVTEFLEKGDLMAILRANKRLEESSVFLILKDLVAVCKYLTSKRILHRDLKLDNILMDKHYRVKLCDFGISVKMRDEVMTEKCGTPAYMPPEAIAGLYSGFGFDVG